MIGFVVPSVINSYLRCVLVTLCVVLSFCAAAELAIFDGKSPVTYNLPTWDRHSVPVLASEMLSGDLEAATGIKPVVTGLDESLIKIYNLSTATSAEKSRLAEAGVDLQTLSRLREGFALKAHEGNLYVIGADDRGTAYGMLEVSRIAGVSPWVWWHDAVPERKNTISIPDDFYTLQAPSVEYRGVFLNDEDWSLRPWSSLTFEPGNPAGMIGTRTYREIFKLLLRLRANTVWPAMHPSTVPFYRVPGAKECADSCGIIIGTSHCEPLLRNNVGEWDAGERGPYNYITNRDNVIDYWAERLREAGKYENLYTIGMRGIHDGNMEGVRTMEERVTALQQVLADQRGLLAKHVSPDLDAVPQILVLYKEVLDIMSHGLAVPHDVTLMWCDDNYGYLTCLGDSLQRKRRGGAGIYYHLSYWGRPHDYLWLGSTQPGLIAHELTEAYAGNARRVWIANVHDLKTSSYGLELFLDMAWNVKSVNPAEVDNHLRSWLAREFGDEIGSDLLEIMREYYRLCALRRPEHMGWTQVELSDRKAYPRGRSHVIDTEFSFTGFGNEADRYLDAWKSIASRVDSLQRSIPSTKLDAYFSMVKYPVAAAAAMAEKMIEAQRARSFAQGESGPALQSRDSLMLAACARSQNAYQRIRTLTAFYNDSLAGGKWRHAMSATPRDLNVFNPPVLPVGLTSEECRRYASVPFRSEVTLPGTGFTALNGCDFTSSTFVPVPVKMLGHSVNALPIPMDEEAVYEFDLDTDSDLRLLIALIPTHPLDGGDIRVSISVDDNEPMVVSYREKGRTDRWKENVLRNQARIMTRHSLGAGHHRLTVKALDPHVILDQILIDTDPLRRHYTIPTTSR